MLEFDFAKTEFFVRVVAFARFIKYHYFGLIWVNRETPISAELIETVEEFL